MSNSYDGASFAYLSNVYNTGQVFHSKELDKLPGKTKKEGLTEKDFEAEVNKLKNKIFKEFDISDDSELLAQIDVSNIDLSQHNVGNLTSPIETIKSALVAVKALEGLMLQRGENKTVKGDGVLKALKINRAKLEQLRDLKAKQSGEVNVRKIQVKERVSFPQMASTENIATNLKTHIESVSKNSTYTKREYSQFAETVRWAVTELAKNPDLESRMRISKTHETSTVSTSKGYEILPIEGHAKPIRSFWVSKSSDGHSIEVQMIHSGPEALVGTGSYKKVKLSSHFTIPLSPAPGDDKIQSTYTVLVRSSTKPNKPKDVAAHLKAQDPKNKSPDKSTVKKFIEDGAAEGPEKLWEQLIQTKLSLKDMRPGLKVAGVDSMRRDLFPVKKTVGRSPKHSQKIEQSKVEMEEKRFVADLTKIQKNLAPWDGILLLHDVAETLSEFHRLGIIHRDVKGPNILVDIQDDHAEGYLADFDLLMAPGKSDITNAYHYWDSATRKGNASKAADIYGFAMTMGDTLFGENFGEFRAAQIQAEDPQEMIGPSVVSAFNNLGLDQAAKEASDACNLSHKEFPPRVLEIIGKYSKENSGIRTALRYPRRAIEELSKCPQGPILDNVHFNSLLEDKVRDLVDGTLSDMDMDDLASEVQNMDLSFDGRTADEIILEYLKDIRDTPDLSTEDRDQIITCMFEVDVLATSHSIIKKVIKANQNLLHDLEKAKRATPRLLRRLTLREKLNPRGTLSSERSRRKLLKEALGDIENYFPSMAELQEDLQKMLANLKYGEID